jgi:hypothetical protein
MLLKLAYNSKISPWDDSIEEILKLLVKVKERHAGVYDYEIIDTSTLSDQNLEDLYTEAMVPSIMKKYQIRQLFGSKKYSASVFGKQQPALLVYDKSKYPMDTFPHINKAQKITIREHLEELLRDNV